MNAFIHPANARNDQRLARFEGVHGPVAYAMYFKLREIFAESVDNQQPGTQTLGYTYKQWGQKTGVSARKFSLLAQDCHNLDLIHAERHADILLISLPDLLTCAVGVES